MPSKTDIIRNKAVELIKSYPGGLRFSELKAKLREEFPVTDGKWTIDNAMWNIDITRSKEVYKPARGLFKYRSFIEGEISDTEKPMETISRHLREEDFYEPFARYLRDNLGECSEAVAFGGSYLGKKWGTPDVIGVYKPSIKNLIQFEPEIISAEIKMNPSDPITAFGQAIAYRLFSSKVYLVEPNQIDSVDKARIEALCMLFGVGLILFDVNLQNPNFSILVRAQRSDPDMFYVNEFADNLDTSKKEVFEKLFGR